MHFHETKKCILQNISIRGYNSVEVQLMSPKDVKVFEMNQFGSPFFCNNPLPANRSFLHFYCTVFLSWSLFQGPQRTFLIKVAILDMEHKVSTANPKYPPSKWKFLFMGSSKYLHIHICHHMVLITPINFFGLWSNILSVTAI